jgi:hypothetical protein
MTSGSPPSKRRSMNDAYLRAAQAYMLISMPTDTSAIFGAFQAIPSLLRRGRRSPSQINYCGSESSPVKYFAVQWLLQCEIKDCFSPCRIFV